MDRFIFSSRLDLVHYLMKKLHGKKKMYCIRLRRRLFGARLKRSSPKTVIVNGDKAMKRNDLIRSLDSASGYRKREGSAVNAP